MAGSFHRRLAPALMVAMFTLAAACDLAPQSAQLEQPNDPSSETSEGPSSPASSDATVDDSAATDDSDGTANSPPDSGSSSTDDGYTQQDPPPQDSQTGEWAFEETFDGTPDGPSQELLPKTLDFDVTMRVKHHGGETSDGRKESTTYEDGGYDLYDMDHGSDCAGGEPFPTHKVYASHRVNGANPGPTFYICRDHMMSSADPDEYYSVSTFYPRQEFDFADGGVIEFDTNIDERERNWYEVMIVPREQTQIAAARSWLPVSESYPSDRIVFIYEKGNRKLQVGTGEPAPKGAIFDGKMGWTSWSQIHPDDPALRDRRIRRTNRLEIENGAISWSIAREDGSFHTVSQDIDIPFTRGLVLFKTHSFDPGNGAPVTWHWDNIRFDGPKLEPYEAHESKPLVINMERKYSGASSPQSVTINVPDVGERPVIQGQTRAGQAGQILLSVNGGPNISVKPHAMPDEKDCYFEHWRTFRVPIEPAQLRAGANELTWKVGPIPACARGTWFEGFSGYSVKGLEIQFD